MWFHSRFSKSKRRLVGLKPTLEILEDRLAPATFAVTTKLDVVDAADGKLSLREAVSRANTNPGPDTIKLPAGIYKITLPGHESNNLAGDFNIQSSVTIVGASASTTIIDGQRLDRVFDIFGSGPSSINVAFQGVTIRGGLNDTFFGGGGILVGNADLVVRDCVVTDNRTALVGGGISNAYAPGTGNVTLLRSTVSRNVAANEGGGLFVVGGAGGQSTLTIKSSTVRRNLSSRLGGGIFADTVTLANSTVSRNIGTAGGGIAATTAILTGSTVRGNAAQNTGGGIFANTATLTNSIVSGNHAGRNAGAIWPQTAILTSSTVNGNTAQAGGGGISGLLVFVTDSTVSSNVAGTGGGGISADTATLTGSTVSGNTAQDVGGGIHAGSATFTSSTVSDNV